MFCILPGDDFIEVFKLLSGDPEAVAKAEGVGLPLFPNINVLVDLVRHLARNYTCISFHCKKAFESPSMSQSSGRCPYCLVG